MLEKVIEMKNKYLILIVISLVFSTSLCKGPSSSDRPNVILIVPDSLRAEQLPLYGYKKIKTESIDSLARNGTVFTNCYVRSASTLFSFSNLFSSLWFPSTGIMNEENVLTTILKKHGFYTVGVVSSHILWQTNSLKQKRSFHKGFDEYFQDVSIDYRKSENTTNDILNWLDKNEKRNPFFLFVHYMDPHYPHYPSYDSQIEKIDNELEKVILKLKQLSLYENSLIIFTSDHGETLGEHNTPEGHGWQLYKDEFNVPLIIKFPKDKYKKKIDHIVRNIDIMPTILDFLDIKSSTETDGVSLLPTIKNNRNLDLIAYQYGGSNRLHPENLEGVFFNKKGSIFHYIQGDYSNRCREFYNITLDPEEMNNIYENRKYIDFIKYGQNIIEKFRVKLKHVYLSDNALNIDEKEMRMLKSLGYIVDGAPSPYMKNGNFAKGFSSVEGLTNATLMSMNLNELGFFSYIDFIRDHSWGINLKDSYYPSKILPIEENRYLIIANEDKGLFQYFNQSGFTPCNINNVEDIAYDAHQKVLYLVQDKILKFIRLIDINKTDSIKSINGFTSCKGIYISPFSNNLFLFEKDYIHKLSGEKKIISSYKISDVRSESFCVDKNDNMYFIKSNKLFRLSNQEQEDLLLKKDPTDSEIISISIDGKQRIWVLDKKRTAISIIFDNQKKNIDFRFDQEDRNPFFLTIMNNKIFIIDNWEGIIIYSLESPAK